MNREFESGLLPPYDLTPDRRRAETSCLGTALTATASTLYPFDMDILGSAPA